MVFRGPPIQLLWKFPIILVVSQGVLSSYLCGYFESFPGELSPVTQGRFTVEETIVKTQITQSDATFKD